MTQTNVEHVVPGAAIRTQRRNVTITTAQLLALFATPIELVPAPGAGFALSFLEMMIQKPAGVAYAGIAADEDLAVKYTNAAGLEVAQCETTGFLDSTANQIRLVKAHAAATGDSSITPVVNAALVLHLLNAEIITGDSDLNCQVLYQVLDTSPAG